MCHIKINMKERALVNCKTAELCHPSCFDTLVVYCSYLVDRDRSNEADDLLKKVFKGEKVISKMIEDAQKVKVV